MPYNNKLLLTVLMSVYNGELYLRDAIESVLYQTYTAFEFVIINDGSTDSTSEIIEDYKNKDQRIKLVHNKVNNGLTETLNKGIALAKGKYIARMDSDDLSISYRFEKQINFLEQNPSCVAVGSAFYQIDERGNIKSFKPVLCDYKEIKDGLMSQNWLCHGSVMLRRDVLLELKGYNERFKYSQDYDLWLRMSESFILSNIPDALYYWRASSNAITISKKAEQKYYANLARSEAKDRRTRESLTIEERTPLVSVIVPTYNRPKMLEQAIDSILKQTYKSFEIIVVNDCGIDVTDVIQKYNSNNMIRYYSHVYNEGLSSARNTGILMAKGKYIAYLDDDDVYYPRHLEILVDYLENNKKKIAYTDAFRKWVKINKETGENEVIKKDNPYSFDFDKQKILLENFIPVLCFLQDRSCLIEENLFDPILKRTEDWDMWIRLSRKWEFAHIKEATCEYTAYQDKHSSMMSGPSEPFAWAALNMFYKYVNYSMAPQVNAKHNQIIKSALFKIKKSIIDQNSYNCFFEGDSNQLINRLIFLSKAYKNYRTQIFDIISIIYYQNLNRIGFCKYKFLSHLFIYNKFLSLIN